MDTVYAYSTHPTSGTVHLVQQRPPSDPRRGSTLCGMTAAGHQPGDETTSGLVATCGTCRALAALPAPRPRQAPAPSPYRHLYAEAVRVADRRGGRRWLTGQGVAPMIEPEVEVFVADVMVRRPGCSCAGELMVARWLLRRWCSEAVWQRAWQRQAGLAAYAAQQAAPQPRARKAPPARQQPAPAPHSPAQAQPAPTAPAGAQAPTGGPRLDPISQVFMPGPAHPTYP